LFQNAKQQAPAPFQKYDLLCCKAKIIQVFELVLQQNPMTEYFFYMEANNDLCTTLTEIWRLAYEYQRWFITTGIGFAGWTPKDPKDHNDILSQQGPHPNVDCHPEISSLAFHSTSDALTMDALTMRMPVADALAATIPSTPAVNAANTNNANAQNVSAVESAALAASKAKKNKGLDKHFPWCGESRRSK
jgi:hypothetical protein